MQLDDKLLEQFKESYYFELNRKDKINGYLNFPLALFTLLVGLIAYFLNNLPEIVLNFSSISFYLFFFILVSIVIIAFSFFIRSFYNYSYYYISIPSEFDDYFKKLGEYNKSVNNAKKIDLDNKHQILMSKQYSEYATVNTITNDRKSRFLHKTSGALILSVIFMLLTCIPYFYIKYNTERQIIVTTKIENLEEIFDMIEKKYHLIGEINFDSDNESENTNEPESPEPEEPQEPEEPKGRIIKEGEDKESKDE